MNKGNFEIHENYCATQSLVDGLISQTVPKEKEARKGIMKINFNIVPLYQV